MLFSLFSVISFLRISRLAALWLESSVPEWKLSKLFKNYSFHSCQLLSGQVTDHQVSFSFSSFLEIVFSYKNDNRMSGSSPHRKPHRLRSLNRYHPPSSVINRIVERILAHSIERKPLSRTVQLEDPLECCGIIHRGGVSDSGHSEDSIVKRGCCRDIGYLPCNLEIMLVLLILVIVWNTRGVSEWTTTRKFSKKWERSGSWVRRSKDTAVRAPAPLHQLDYEEVERR